MRFGVCAGMDRCKELAEIGYDYVELSVAGDLIPDSPTEAWREQRARIMDLPLRPETFNSFVRTGRLVGPDLDRQWIERYVHTALERAAEVGGGIVVFGSGGARNLPDGYPLERGMEDLISFLQLCADASDRTGVTVAIEPLCRAECNVINLVSEATGLTSAVSRPGVRALADTYHMEAEAEPLAAIPDAGPLLAHAHTADTGRRAPGTGKYDHAAFFRALAEAGYESRVSIECGWGTDFPAEARVALRHLRAAYAVATGIS